ncbi:MAG: VWA-like domain-containing protein [Firmicutes bacterium]|nr:VWA-like domain-containing protein [Bacillota bacterium]
MTEQRKQRLKRQLQESRYRLDQLDAAFAAPLRKMLFAATKDVKRISTNGSCIYFDPDWLQKLGHTELDFILSHQLMHIALGHIDRPKYYSGDRFHLACDIVANSHLELLGWNYDLLPHIGRIFHETFFPAQPGRLLTAQEALHCVPFDPAAMEPGARNNYMIDAESWWDRKQDRGENCVIVLCPGDEDPEDLPRGERTAGGGHCFVKKEFFRKDGMRITKNELPENNQAPASGSWDQCAANELRILRSAVRKDAGTGFEEASEERLWQRTDPADLDWRKLLDSFIQEEVCDYSFTPPDRRFLDSGFFLPDCGMLTENPKKVLFMADTSGSVDTVMLSAVYGEICSALTQFNGGLAGILGFFDMQVYPPVPFSNIGDLLQIRPRGGGTSFHCVFDYIRRNMSDDPPVNIVIFTDGQAEFPDESAAGNIPVLWLFSDRRVVPPWGKYAYVGSAGK